MSIELERTEVLCPWCGAVLYEIVEEEKHTKAWGCSECTL
jgi:ssDNA-binding Zn-finger/Zn-ribbon topoisomerase 1